MADPDSKLGILNNIFDTTPGSYLVIDTSDSRFESTANSLFGEVMGQSVMIYSEFMLRTYLYRMGCTTQPEMTTQINISKESMTPGRLHPIFSHRIPTPMLEWLEYQVQTILEFDLANCMLDFVIGRIMAENQIPRTSIYYKCMDQVVEKESLLKQFMAIHDIKLTIRVIVILMVMAMVVLVCELIYSVLKPRM